MQSKFYLCWLLTSGYCFGYEKREPGAGASQPVQIAIEVLPTCECFFAYPSDVVFSLGQQCKNATQRRLKLRNGFNGLAAGAGAYVCQLGSGVADHHDNQHEERRQLGIAVQLSNNLIRSKIQIRWT
jgi:hypothetical protein